MEDYRIDPRVVRFVRIGLQACGSVRDGLRRGDFMKNSCGATRRTYWVLGQRVIIGADW